MSKTIVILLEKDFQDLEAWYPYLRLREEGFTTWFVGLGEKTYRGKNGYPATVDKNIEEVEAHSLAGLIIPGGWAPDHLRKSKKVLDLVKTLNEEKKLIGAICHAGWVIASAGIVKGRTVTSYEAIKDDLIHAGAEWVDKEVVADGNLITSRTPLDLPAFCREIIRFLTMKAVEG